jgi:hypothetical protein
MSKFKIEHGASKVNLVLLKTNIEDTISQDIDQLCSWSQVRRQRAAALCADPGRGLPTVQSQLRRKSRACRRQCEAWAHINQTRI